MQEKKPQNLYIMYAVFHVIFSSMMGMKNSGMVS